MPAASPAAAVRAAGCQQPAEGNDTASRLPNGECQQRSSSSTSVHGVSSEASSILTAAVRAAGCQQQGRRQQYSLAAGCQQQGRRQQYSKQAVQRRASAAVVAARPSTVSAAGPAAFWRRPCEQAAGCQQQGQRQQYSLAAAVRAAGCRQQGRRQQYSKQAAQRRASAAVVAARPSTVSAAGPAAFWRRPCEQQGASNEFSGGRRQRYSKQTVRRRVSAAVVAARPSMVSAARPAAFWRRR